MCHFLNYHQEPSSEWVNRQNFQGNHRYPFYIQNSTNDDALTYDKQNSLCYAAGYVPKCLRNCIKHSGHPLKRLYVEIA